MERRRAVFLCALSAAAAVAALLVPEARPDISVLAILMGAGVAAAVLTGYGGEYLLLCLGEAFAVAVGTVTPVLGVLFQPVIAGMLCGDDRTSLIIGGATTIMAAAGVLLFRDVLSLLLALLLVSAGMVLGLMGCETWMRHRFSKGSTA